MGWKSPPGGSNLCIMVLRVPVPNRPNSFCMQCGVPSCTHNALTCAWTPRWQGTAGDLPSRAVQGFSFLPGQNGLKMGGIVPFQHPKGSWITFGKTHFRP